MAIIAPATGTLYNNRGSMRVWVGIPANDPGSTLFDNRGSMNVYVQTAFTLTFVTSSPLTNGTQNSAYSNAIVAASGSGTYTYVVTVGSTPTGITLNSDGTLTGTPTGTGTSNFTVKATDSFGNTGSQAYQLTINASGGGGSGQAGYLSLLGVGQ